ncbi:hypothetical protein RJ639_037202 [Escallonia herrerae]|uniref:J domain-containing protein n=1 Tax=Escallonia herrerae TaxID=1293975 RepID=A0AA88WN26_9ASTE|nr:hypothetical protein RJ639_037202 [Escallonia herrerae]
MNRVAKGAQVINPQQANPFELKTALFHSTPVLDRKRRTHWDSGGGSSSYSTRGSSRRFNQHAKRFRRLNEKQELLRNVSAFAERLFQGHQYDYDEFHPYSSQSSSWARRDYRARGFNGSFNKGPQASSRSGFRFFDDGDEFEANFRSFSRSGFFYWDFINEEPLRGSSGYSDFFRSSWRHRNDDDYDSSTDSDSRESDLSSVRLALGLSASGPLNLEDVKNAYRSCALKWHPDRHEGSSKAVAEEKFKVCSAAYQALCDKLVMT